MANSSKPISVNPIYKNKTFVATVLGILFILAVGIALAISYNMFNNQSGAGEDLSVKSSGTKSVSTRSSSSTRGVSSSRSVSSAAPRR